MAPKKRGRKPAPKSKPSSPPPSPPPETPIPAQPQTLSSSEPPASPPSVSPQAPTLSETHATDADLASNVVSESHTVVVAAEQMPKKKVVRVVKKIVKKKIVRGKAVEPLEDVSESVGNVADSTTVFGNSAVEEGVSMVVDVGDLGEKGVLVSDASGLVEKEDGFGVAMDGVEDNNDSEGKKDVVVEENKETKESTVAGDAIVKEKTDVEENTVAGDAIIAEKKEIEENVVASDAVVEKKKEVEENMVAGNAVTEENKNTEENLVGGSSVIEEKKVTEVNLVAGNSVIEEKKEPEKNLVGDETVIEEKNKAEENLVAGDAVVDEKMEGEENAVVGDAVVVEKKGVEGEEKGVAGDAGVGDEEAHISERRKRRKTEIFVGGLDRDAKEEDLRSVFGKVGEIVEVRMMMDGQTRKNKGFAFVRYKEAGQAKQAVSEFSKVEICGKLCGAAALEGNDTIFLGNIDKKWKKEDLIQVLQDIGIEKIDTVTVMVDPHNNETNRGFAFLELESNKDAQAAYKKLSKKDAFGKGLNVKVAWAEPLDDPDEEEMQKVKSVYVECIPSSWDETKVRESFNKFGEIERIVLARNLPSAKRKDYAFVNYTTREAALSCIEYFDKEDIPDNCSEAKLKVSLAKPKPTGKAKQNRGMSKLPSSEMVKTKSFQETKFRFGASNGSSSRGFPSYSTGNSKFSAPNEISHSQAARQQGQVGYGRGPALPDYSHSVVGGKRSYSALGRGEGAPYSEFRGFPRARFGHSYPAASSSYGVVPQVPPGPSMPYYQRPPAGYGSGPPPPYGVGRPNITFQRQGFPPFGSNMYPRY